MTGWWCVLRGGAHERSTLRESTRTTSGRLGGASGTSEREANGNSISRCSYFIGVGDHDITEFDITESDVTFFQEFDITESDITEKGNFYNGIRYNGICYNMKLEIGITKFVTVESDITGKWKLI